MSPRRNHSSTRSVWIEDDPNMSSESKNWIGRSPILEYVHIQGNVSTYRRQYQRPHLLDQINGLGHRSLFGQGDYLHRGIAVREATLDGPAVAQVDVVHGRGSPLLMRIISLMMSSLVKSSTSSTIVVDWSGNTTIIIIFIFGRSLTRQIDEDEVMD